MSDTLSAPLNAADSEIAGTAPEVSAPDLEPSQETQYAIRNESQAVAVAQTLRDNSDAIIKNAAEITHILNGAPPFNPAALKQAGRDWFPNVSTKFLRNQCSPIPSRLFMPVLTATTLTAASLPPGWPMGPQKTRKFRHRVTNAFRAWPGWVWFNKQLATEVAYFGYGFATWFDEYEWRPNFVRCTRGFVPIGTKIDDESGPPLYCVAYDYRVDDLLRHVEKNRKAGLDNWKLEAVAAAVNAAQPKPKDESEQNRREYAEHVRNATIGETFEKAYRVIPTLHLFSADPDGTVSHHIVLDSSAQTKQPSTTVEDKAGRLLFEKRGQFREMYDTMAPLLFDPETGTIHGSWGAGQYLFDLALEFERSFMDWVANMKMSAKFKVQTNTGTNPEEVRLQVDDVMATLSGAQFAGNTAAVPTDPRPFQVLLEAFGASAREIIGNYIPPIPLTPSDVKAAQVDAKLKEQQERREQTLLLLLLQYARIIRTMVRRITSPDSDDPEAKQLQKDLVADGLTREEIELLANQPPVTTIFDFTTYAQEKQAAFAAAKSGNPFYNQARLERVQAETLGRDFAEEVLLPGEDATTERMARRQQQLETTSMLAGTVVEVLPIDSDYAHMQELRPVIEQQVMGGGDPNIIQILNTHLSSHFVGATNKKGWPPGESGNQMKAFINKVAEFLRTGQLPANGLADSPDPIGEMEQQMKAVPPLLGPGDNAPAPTDTASAAGLGELVNGSTR